MKRNGTLADAAPVLGWACARCLRGGARCSPPAATSTGRETHATPSAFSFRLTEAQSLKNLPRGAHSQPARQRVFDSRIAGSRRVSSVLEPGCLIGKDAEQLPAVILVLRAQVMHILRCGWLEAGSPWVRSQAWRGKGPGGLRGCRSVYLLPARPIEGSTSCPGRRRERLHSTCFPLGRANQMTLHMGCKRGCPGQQELGEQPLQGGQQKAWNSGWSPGFLTSSEAQLPQEMGMFMMPASLRAP